MEIHMAFKLNEEALHSCCPLSLPFLLSSYFSIKIKTRKEFQGHNNAKNIIPCVLMLHELIQFMIIGITQCFERS